MFRAMRFTCRMPHASAACFIQFNGEWVLCVCVRAIEQRQRWQQQLRRLTSIERIERVTSSSLSQHAWWRLQSIWWKHKTKKKTHRHKSLAHAGCWSGLRSETPNVQCSTFTHWMGDPLVLSLLFFVRFGRGRVFSLAFFFICFNKKQITLVGLLARSDRHRKSYDFV